MLCVGKFVLFLFLEVVEVFTVLRVFGFIALIAAAAVAAGTHSSGRWMRLRAGAFGSTLAFLFTTASFRCFFFCTWHVLIKVYGLT